MGMHVLVIILSFSTFRSIFWERNHNIQVWNLQTIREIRSFGRTAETIYSEPNRLPRPHALESAYRLSKREGQSKYLRNSCSRHYLACLTCHSLIGWWFSWATPSLRRYEGFRLTGLPWLILEHNSPVLFQIRTRLYCLCHIDAVTGTDCRTTNWYG